MLDHRWFAAPLPSTPELVFRISVPFPFSNHTDKMANAWLTHLKKFYAANKSKMSYAEAMKAAKATYKKKGSTAAPKKKRGRKKKHRE